MTVNGKIGWAKRGKTPFSNGDIQETNASLPAGC